MNRIHLMPGGSSLEPVPFIPVQPAWVFWAILAMFILLAWIQVFHFRRFDLLLKANFSGRCLHQFLREGNPFRERISIALALIYLFTLALLLFFAIRIADPGIISVIPEFRFFLILVFSIAGFWACKILFMEFLNTVFRTDRINREYQVNILLMTSLLGIVLLVLLVVSVYLRSEWMIGAGVCLVSAASVYRFVKGFIIGISLTRFSYFYLFIYLCTLEILPVLVMVKVIRHYF